MTSLFMKQNNTIIQREGCVLKNTNSRLPCFYARFLPDPLYLTAFTSLAFLLLVLFPSHLDEGLQGDKEVKSAQPECRPLQPCCWRKQPDQASLSIQGTEDWISGIVPGSQQVFLHGVTMKNKKASPGTAAAILWKCRNPKDPDNKHGVIYTYSEKAWKQLNKTSSVLLIFR